MNKENEPARLRFLEAAGIIGHGRRSAEGELR